jgi:F-type H+-transporting ATPase subunit b
MAASMLMLVAASALGAEAEHGSANNPFAGDIGNAIWTVTIFLLVVVLLGKFAWKPILGALQKREQFILDSLAQAKTDREEAARQMREYSEKLNQARAEASAIVEEGRRDAEALRHRIEDQAKNEAQAMLERAKREIGIARDTAVKELYTLSARLATDMASRIIRKELDGKEHERLISESINELEQAVSA